MATTTTPAGRSAATMPAGGRPGFGERRRGEGFARRRAKQPAPPPVPYAVGDDVVHASFGEGVVTAVEPGAVVVVRFAGDGAERKLMADYAPLRSGSRERPGDRRQGGRRRGSRAGRRRGRASSPRRTGSGARARHRARRRRPGLRTSTSATSASRPRRSGCARSTSARRPRRPRTSCSSWSPRSTTTTSVDGILVQLPLPDADRPGRGDRGDRRRPRTSTGSPRPAPACSPRGGRASSRARRRAWSSCCATRRSSSRARRR